MSAANDVSLDTINPIKKRDAVGNLIGNDNKALPAGDSGIIIDYPRKYRNGNSIQSPFGFAFNGGDFLPGALTLVTDQPIYVQGDFNNNGLSPTPVAPKTTSDAAPDRLPASIIGDVITVLSNQCLANSSALSATNFLGVPASQIKCGLPKSTLGSVDVNFAGGPAANPYGANVTTVNAAFLSNTNRSVGNLGAGRGWTNNPANKQFGGAINNYMRMLEDWGGPGGQFFNYTGSFVSLGTPIEANAPYASGSPTAATGYYGVPQRNFNFDTNFNNFNTLPPLPPRAIYLQQEVFKRSY
jgi:hypothetical protein